MIRPGEIYMADFGEAGPHPVIILSREDLNRGRYALLSLEYRGGSHLGLDAGKPPRDAGNRVFCRVSPTMNERRETRKRWVQRGQYAVEVEVEVLYPEDSPTEPCLESATVRWLDEVARRAAAGDLDYLQKVGRVFQAVSE